MRPPEETEHNYIIFAYADAKGNDAIRLTTVKKVTSIAIDCYLKNITLTLRQG